MDRNEQINEGYKKVFGGTPSDSGNMWSAFVSGARWADAHPIDANPVWVSPKDRLPEKLKPFNGHTLSAYVLQYFGSSLYALGYYDFDLNRWVNNQNHETPIYWMSLPW